MILSPWNSMDITWSSSILVLRSIGEGGWNGSEKQGGKSTLDIRAVICEGYRTDDPSGGILA